MVVDKKRGLPLAVVSLCAAAVAGPAAAADGKIYWTEYGSHQIKAAGLDGANPGVVVQATWPGAIALDLVGRDLYWVQRSTVWATTPDGAGRREVIYLPGSGLDPFRLEVDGERGKVYYGQPELEAAGNIGRFDVDGSGREVIVPGATVWDIELDRENAKIYFSNYDFLDDRAEVKRADFDGSNVETLFEAVALGLALDVAAGKIYWLEDSSSTSPQETIRRANLDGADPEILLAADDLGWLLEVDPLHGKLYYAPRDSQIRRANLDGTADELVISGVWAADLALDPAGDGIFVPAVSDLGALLLALLLAAIVTHFLRR